MLLVLLGLGVFGVGFENEWCRAIYEGSGIFPIITTFNTDLEAVERLRRVRRARLVFAAPKCFADRRRQVLYIMRQRQRMAFCRKDCVGMPRWCDRRVRLVKQEVQVLSLISYFLDRLVDGSRPTLSVSDKTNDSIRSSFYAHRQLHVPLSRHDSVLTSPVSTLRNVANPHLVRKRLLISCNIRAPTRR